MSTVSHSFARDSRGNRLQSFHVERLQTGHNLYLCGPDEAAAQVLACDRRYGLLPVDRGATGWTHLLYSLHSEPSSETTELLGVLTEVLSLPCGPNFDFAVTLDWYKIPEPGVPGAQWMNTEAGDLVNRGKYRYRTDPDRQAEVGRELVGMMVDVARRHPLIRTADVVLDAPGHDSGRVSFGGRVAATVAKDLGVPRRRMMCTEAFRPEAKSLDPSQRAATLAGKFQCDDVRGLSVLLVDDVYSSGATLAEAARAARAAGAVAVAGLTAVRTMRY